MAAPRDENVPSRIVSISRIVSVHQKLLQPDQRVLNLSNLDRQCPTLMHLVFFYKHQTLKDHLSLNSVFTRLKSGLEETLNVWYPGAGRLRQNQNDEKLNLWCNNEGAILVEAETPVKISQLGDLSQYSDFFEKLVYKPAFDDGNFSNMPLIVAQVTKFGCGGYSIGIGTSHSLFDGPATYDFLNAWASNSEIVKEKSDQEVPKPVHERGILLLSDNPQTSKGTINLPSNSSLNAQQQARAMAIDHLYQLIMQAAGGSKGFPLKIIGPSDQNKCVLKTYHLSGAMIDYLEKKHFPMWKSGPLPFSTFEVLAAHLWKARTKALGVRKENMVCLQFAVDTRKRVVPPLPKAFSGNAYVLASVMMPVVELESASYEGIIEKIREAKNAVNHDYVRTYIEAFEGSANGSSSLPPLKELTLVSDWTRMPFHNIEFFHGKAAYACPLATPVPQVAYFMQSPTADGGVDVRIGIEAETLDAFTHCFLNKGAGKHSITGDMFGLLSAICYGLYTVLLKSSAGSGDKVDIQRFFGCIGLYCLLAFWWLAWPLNVARIEPPFEFPSSMSTWKIIIANSIWSSVISDYFWALSIVWTSPLVSTLGLSLTIPVAMIADMVIHGRKYSATYILGCIQVFAGFTLANLSDKFSRNDAQLTTCCPEKQEFCKLNEDE